MARGNDARVAWAAYFREKEYVNELKQQRAELRKERDALEIKAKKADRDAGLWFGVSLVCMYIILMFIWG